MYKYDDIHDNDGLTYLPWTPHLVAKCPILNPIWSVMSISPAKVGIVSIPVAVTVLEPGNGLI